MSEPILKSLAELRKANVIDEVTEERIRNYYQAKKPSSGNKSMIVFSIIGALLVGLGIILVVAHNWDELSRPVKTFFAFSPMILAQGLCGFTLLRKREQAGWRESAALLLCLTIGSCISLISQIYNIEGSLSSFLFTWVLLCFPVAYVMQSSATALFYIAMITWYGILEGYDISFFSLSEPDYWYWFLLLLILPYAFLLHRFRAGNNFFLLYHLFLAVSIAIMLGSLFIEAEEITWVVLGYLGLFGIFLLLENMEVLKNERFRRTPYWIIGMAGSIGLLLMLSFRSFWDELLVDSTGLDYSADSIITLIGLLIIAIFLFYQMINKMEWSDFTLSDVLLPIFLVVFFSGFISPVLAMLLDNLLVLGIGIYWIRRGLSMNHLGVLNFGLLIIGALTICRFFDTNLSFVVRGLLFIAVGILFFVLNYLTIKKRKELQHET